MVANRPAKSRRYFTSAEAKATLPLVRAIVEDVTRLARDLEERYERLERVRPRNGMALMEAYQEEVRYVQEEFERDQETMRGYERELKQLGVELKDYRSGLVDFPSRMAGRDVYLCWRLGEPDVDHWHEIEAGFAGRQALPASEGGAAPEAGERSRDL